MKLADLLNSPTAHHVRPRSVKFRLSGHDRAGNVAKVEEAEAALVLVNERDRAEAVRDADAELAGEYGTTPISEVERGNRRIYHLLFRALRDTSDGKSKFAASVLELRQALNLLEAGHVWGEYSMFVAEEFPEHVSPEEMERLTAEARSKSSGVQT